MFQPWRLKLREAHDAFRGGRLSEAGRLLCESGVREFRPAKEMLAKIIERRLREAEQSLAAGEPAAALARLESLDAQYAATAEVRMVRDAALRIATAQRFVRRGEFVRAEQEWGRAAALLPHLAALEDGARACKVKGAEIRELAAALHAALAGEQWPAVLRQAEGILAMCPDHEAAREARRRAWSAVGIDVRSIGIPPVLEQAGRLRHKNRQAGRLRYDEQQACRNGSAMDQSTNTYSGTSQPQPAAASNFRPIDRFLLWVDGVGGYLVCTRDEVTLGQPVPQCQVDIPILGDLSRGHAKIRRDGEVYVIEPHRPVRLAGRTIDRSTALTDGVLIEAGNVRLRFRRPHPLSGTARLEFVSSHRTQPSADAVLLMAESCVLGPNTQNHVVCGGWSRELLLYRQGDELFCRRAGRFQVDGQPADDSGRLTFKSQISGEDFSLSIESLVG